MVALMIADIGLLISLAGYEGSDHCKKNYMIHQRQSEAKKRAFRKRKDFGFP